MPGLEASCLVKNLFRPESSWTDLRRVVSRRCVLVRTEFHQLYQLLTIAYLFTFHRAYFSRAKLYQLSSTELSGPCIEQIKEIGFHSLVLFLFEYEISVSLDKDFVAPNNDINVCYNVDAFNDKRNVLTSLNDALCIVNLMFQLHF